MRQLRRVSTDRRKKCQQNQRLNNGIVTSQRSRLLFNKQPANQSCKSIQSLQALNHLTNKNHRMNLRPATSTREQGWLLAIMVSVIIFIILQFASFTKLLSPSPLTQASERFTRPESTTIDQDLCQLSLFF